MIKKQLKNIPGMNEEETVTIWKMNYGFKSDLQGEISDMKLEGEGDNVKGNARMNISKLKILNNAFGILESEALGIKEPSDYGLGFKEKEKEDRIRKVRLLDNQTGSFIFNEISKLNKENKEEKKSIKKN